MKESHTNEITLKWRLKRQKLTKKKKKEKQRKEEERTVMARYEGPVVEKSSRFKSRRRVNIYFLSMVEPNRSTSCNYMKENSGMKKWKQKKKRKRRKTRKLRRKKNGMKEKRRNEGREKSASVRKRKWREKSLLRRSIDGGFDTANGFVARSMPLVDRKRKIVYATTIIRIAST